jgi:hypothetical protein
VAVLAAISVRNAAKSKPSLIVAGIEGLGVIVDELAKHAILQWGVDRLRDAFGDSGVLTFISRHPFVSWCVLALLWVIFVFLRAWTHPGGQAPAESLSVSERPPITTRVNQATYGRQSPIAGRDVIQNLYTLPPEPPRAKHPDVIIERVGDTATGTLRLYNRGDEEAHSITLTELVGENGVISWKHPSRLAARTEAAIRFVIRNPGEHKNKVSSKEHDAAALVALLLHVNYPKQISEAQASQAFQPVKRVVLVRYLELSTRTYWQTPCEFVYDRESRSLDVNADDATPVLPEHLGRR